jgi:hypothetical protein
MVDQAPLADAFIPPDALPADSGGLEASSESGGPGGPSGCAVGKAAFTAHVTDQASLFSVSPLPALAGGAAFEGRSYMTVKPAYTGMMVPIYAPTRMTLYAAKHYLLPGAPAGYVADWALEFHATCETTLQIGFAHVKSVVKKIEDVYTAGLSTSSGTEQTARPVDFEAGELIGHYIKGTNSIAWDFIVLDHTITNTFANQPRYQMSRVKLLNVICPFERYVEPLRQSYLDLLAGPGQPPGGMLGCGTVARDQPGTAAGAWFLDPNPATGVYGAAPRGNYGSPFAAFRGEDGVVYLAGLNNLSLRIQSDNPTHRDPRSVTGSHCYQNYPMPSNPDGYVMLNLTSATQMQVAYSPTGVCPATIPAGFETYYR